MDPKVLVRAIPDQITMATFLYTIIVAKEALIFGCHVEVKKSLKERKMQNIYILLGKWPKKDR